MIIQSIKMALQSVYSNKLRSFLTMLGIIIGVYSIVVLISVINGTAGYVSDALSEMGTNDISVEVLKDKGRPITDDDLEEIGNIENVAAVAPTIYDPKVQLVGTGKEREGELYAVTPAYYGIIHEPVLYGRAISSIDEENSLSVAVLNYEGARALFGRVDCVGETVKVNGYDYKVVGVLQRPTGFTGLITAGSYAVDVPLSTYTRQANVTFNGYSTFEVGAASSEASAQVTEDLTRFLLKRFENDDDAFFVMDQTEVLDTFGTVTTALSIVFGGVAAISLLVGGIGIMNIMMVSVTERTREIGIRKAIGASKGTILLQFLIEAFAICLTGCAVALILAQLTVNLVNAVIAALGYDIAFRISLGVILLSFGFAMLLGLVFGIYPANKAASMKPIDALRFDA